MTYSRDERLALAALLARVGPDAPTLCAGWQARDLAAHLVLRERRPDAAAGVMGGPLAGHTARVQRRYQQRHSYMELIEIFRNGPPLLSPFAIPGADAAANTVEYFVHHEDVRRAADGWTERELPEGLSDALWSRLRGTRLFLRGAPVGIVLARAGDAGTGRTARVTVKNAAPAVTVTGSPAELTMWATGRTSASHVTFDGDDEDVASLLAWRPRGLRGRDAPAND